MKFNPIRELAKSNEHQILYSKAKELNLKLFINDIDLTPLQLSYLNWLEIYSIIYQDIARHEEYATDELLKSDLLCDAYLTYRRKEKNTKKKKTDNANMGSSDIPSVVFE